MASDFDYVATAKCGCVTGLRVDDADKATGKTVAKWISEGRAVTRMTREEWSKLPLFNKCPHKAQADQMELEGV